MVLILFLIPFLLFVISTLVLINAGRHPKEKITIFFITPENIDKDSSAIISIVRFIFWTSLIASVYIVHLIYSNRGYS